MIVDELKFVTQDIPISERGAYSSSRWLSNDMKIREKTYTTIQEGIEYSFGENEKGGIVVFSTEVNAVDFSENKLINWVKKKAATFKNNISKNKKINNIGQKHDLAAWTVGKALSGRYTAKNGKVFDEKSLSVEIIGVTSEELIKIAEELCIEFLQEAVLVKDYSTGSVFLVNAE